MKLIPLAEYRKKLFQSKNILEKRMKEEKVQERTHLDRVAFSEKLIHGYESGLIEVDDAIAKLDEAIEAINTEEK